MTDGDKFRIITEKDWLDFKEMFDEGFHEEESYRKDIYYGNNADGYLDEDGISAQEAAFMNGYLAS